MVNFTIYAGGYVGFIASFLFNPDAGSLTLLNKNPSGLNPSWISLHPTNKSILYAVNENVQGGLQSFLIENGGLLSPPIDTVSSGGSLPAYTAALSTGQVAVMNYNSGNGFIFPTTAGGVNFQSAPLITFPVPPSGVSHPHMAYPYKNELFVPDLGADKIYRLVETSSGNWIIHGFITQPAGSGPRHMRIYDDILYTLHELSSSLTSQTIPMLPENSSNIISNVNITPPNFPSGTIFAAAEILIPPTSSTFLPTIYASNRNKGIQDPRGDAIAICAFDKSTGEVKLVKEVYTGLDQVRGMQFGGPDNRYLIAGGYAGTGGVVMYERTEGGRELREVVRNTEIPTATSFVWT